MTKTKAPLGVLAVLCAIACGGAGESEEGAQRGQSSPVGASAYASAVLGDGPQSYWRLGEASGSATAANEIAGAPSGSYHGASLALPGAVADGNTAAGFSHATGSN